MLGPRRFAVRFSLVLSFYRHSQSRKIVVYGSSLGVDCGKVMRHAACIRIALPLNSTTASAKSAQPTKSSVVTRPFASRASIREVYQPVCRILSDLVRGICECRDYPLLTSGSGKML
ncbi:hypothetical protein B0T22DRAFT_447847 [Podospora appendiculata]|uniref:Uncharacterized protein n=1 Tax=Podospora appendiculata TaxID=314037 RepID=A0AAE0XG02_9PEZI|nr:hypothetical protein B0T22DRAFT_447847 [Podospora appendiculata]